jgi:glycosyltransferase involved in cell wall biosynthesis
MDPNRGNMASLKGVFDRLGAQYGPRVVLRIVSSRPFEPNTALQTEFVPWELEQSRRDLQLFDMGIMPLRDDEWNRGKCGFKLIQYMAVAAPTVASPVGVNQEIVVDGKTGYLAATEEDWYDRLQRLIDDRVSRVEMGRAGRERVEQHYSLLTVLPTLVDVLTREAATAGGS